MPDTLLSGIPVHGTAVYNRTRKEQKPLEELIPLFKAVLDDPACEEFIWQQYTPYFNAGEPCEFNTYGCYSLSQAAIAKRDKDEYGDFDIWDYEVYGFEDEQYSEPVKALAKAVNSGEFDGVLLSTFGDHAEITLKSDGFHIESHDHD